MTWTISDVIEDTSRSFAKSWVALVFGNLIAGLIIMLPVGLSALVAVPSLIKVAQAAQAGATVEFPTNAFGLLVFSFVPAFVLGIMFAPALSRMALAAARGESVRIGDVFDFRRAGTYFGAGLLTGLAVMAATLLLIVPGIIAALGLSMVSFFVVDDVRLGATDSLEASWNATRGHRLHLLGLLLLAAVANWILQTVFGLTVWLVPLQLALMLAATPFSTLLLAHVYLRVRPRSPVA